MRRNMEVSNTTLIFFMSKSVIIFYTVIRWLLLCCKFSCDWCTYGHYVKLCGLEYKIADHVTGLMLIHSNILLQFFVTNKGLGFFRDSNYAIIKRSNIVLLLETNACQINNFIHHLVINYAKYSFACVRHILDPRPIDTRVLY